MARKQYKFWLDERREEDWQINAAIEKLKAKRSFSSTIRDGIRLICDLRAGRLDVLFELFPWVQGEFLKQQTPTSDNSDLKAEVQRLQELILRQGIIPPGAPLVASPPRKPSRMERPLPEPAIAAADSSTALLDAFDAFL